MARAIVSFLVALLLPAFLVADVTPAHSGVLGRDSAENVRLELRTAGGTPYIDLANDETSDYNARFVLLPGSLDIYGSGNGIVRIFNSLSVAGVIHATAGGVRFPDGTLQTTAGVGVPAAHGSLHLPEGSDPLATGVPVSIGTTNSAGTANLLARADHVHAHGNQGGGSLHATASGSAAGFMSQADKAKLDGATASTTPNTLMLRDGTGGFGAARLDLPVTTSASSGVITMGGSRYFHRGTSIDHNSLYVGYFAGNMTATGSINTGVGASTMMDLTTGSNNVSLGTFALRKITSGSQNVAIGDAALFSSTADHYNIAVGRGALLYLEGGERNIAIGNHAGLSLETGSNNIYIGSSGANESSTIRIGSAAQTTAYIAGISGRTSTSGVAVFVNGDGKLGTVTSSRRFKTDIEPLESVTDLVTSLRPVSFHYREDVDPDGVPQFGLIAEEVADVAPELVVRGADGRPETVRYHLLTPLLVQTVREQRVEIDDLRARIARLEELLNGKP